MEQSKGISETEIRAAWTTPWEPRGEMEGDRAGVLEVTERELA